MTRIDLSHSTTSARRLGWLRPAVTGVGLVGMLALAGCGGTGGTGTSGDSTTPASASSASESASTGAQPAGDTMGKATVKDKDDKELGTVTFSAAEGDAVRVTAELQAMDPGFYGFHVHSIGKCEPGSQDPKDSAKTGDFLSAGGHLNPEDTKHPEHAGDLPPLLVMQDGKASLTFDTDRLTMDNLMDDDGSSVMIHSKADNFANIPERYASSGADDETVKAGDSGNRIGCGTVEKES